MRPTVSVIVPCFNAEKTVARTLDSLVKQTLDNLEIIVINDGSTDHTKDIIENYITDHKEINICLYTKENEGIASARNYALTKVHGEYFGFLDSDDYAEKEMFEDLYQLAKKDDLEVAVSDFWWEMDDSQRLEKEGPYNCKQDMMVHFELVKIREAVYLGKQNYTKIARYRYPKLRVIRVR